MSKLASPTHPNDGGYEKKVTVPVHLSDGTSSRGGDTNNSAFEARVSNQSQN